MFWEICRFCCASELFHIVGDHIGVYADDTTIYSVFPRPLSRSEVLESRSQDLAAKDSWCLKWHTRPSFKKTKSMVVNRSRIYAPGYGHVTFGDAEVKVVKNLHILAVTLDSKLTFKTYLREIVSKAARNLGVMRRAGKLFDCLCVLKSCFNGYVLSNLS